MQIETNRMVAFSWPWKKESIGVAHRYKDSWNDPNYRCVFDTHVHSASLAIGYITIVGTIVGTICSFIINFISGTEGVVTDELQTIVYILLAWAFIISISCNTALLIGNKKKIVWMYNGYLIGNVVGIFYYYFASIVSVALALVLLLSGYYDYTNSARSIMIPIYVFASFVTFLAFAFHMYSFTVVRRDLLYVRNILLNPNAH
ncbi:hypothetical protein M3Y94_01250300 [Aphelenchoides besseyi]|nr:hypothetical protein M3Y94_01250300 [Aphelenchoides besseyi]